MAYLTEIELGAAGLGYLRDCLDGWGGLADKALDLALEKGRMTALLPKGLPFERVLDFEHGGMNIRGEEGPWMASHFLAIKAEHPASSVVIQDTMTLSSHGPMEEDDRVFFIDGHVYSYANSDRFDDAKEMGEIVWRSAAFYVIGFVLGCKVDEDALRNSEASESDLLSMANNILEIFVSAYDGESFVIWRP